MTWGEYAGCGGRVVTAQQCLSAGCECDGHSSGSPTDECGCGCDIRLDRAAVAGANQYRHKV